MVRRYTSKPRKGGYHMLPKSPVPQRDVQIEDVDRTLFSPDSRQQEVDSQRAIDSYLQSHAFNGRIPSRDYMD